MPSPNFIDYVKICCRSGHGGAGSMHFHRAKGIPKGGPDGGNGGKGGDVVLVGNNQLWTLLHLKYKRHIFASDGNPGSSALKHGADGKNAVIEVPLGTIAKDPETGEIELEITINNEKKILLAGGRGGMGNAHFKSSTMRTPRFAQPGEPEQERWKILELKLLADVGLVGLPNAGKSTLLSVLTAARPKIADYPFTTLVPNLGVVAYRNHRSFVMADIPGIIEGAHEGKGLGTRFLRHIERNALLLLMVPADSEDIRKEYDVLLNELNLYNRQLVKKKRLLAITKCDLADNEIKILLKKEIPDIPHLFISSVTGEGLDELKDLLWRKLNNNDE